MDKEFKNIEDLFKSKFEDYQVQPSEQLWNNIDAKLKIRRYFQSGFSKILGLSVITVIIALSIFYFNNNSVNVSNQANQQKTINTKKIIQKTDHIIQKGKQKLSDKILYNEQNKLSIDNKKTENPIERADETVPLIISKSIKIIEINDEQKSDNKIKLTKPTAPSPIFSLDAKEGCAPFTVNIQNLSKSAVGYEWDFGDGNHSEDFMPQYTYRYPGVYKITLKAKGLGGTAVSFIDSIVIHENPQASVLWPYESEILCGQKIQIPNHSKNIAKVEWNFGDKHFSNEKNGQHIFKQKGQYTICMKVWSENGCVDSAIINNIKVIDINEKIIFPNAFTPNLNGPVSGHYTTVDLHNDVFYPKYKGEIEEYEMRIFSKYGVEVFKSNDILYGWNGYYQNRLMPEGVYVYIVHGMFAGNQKFELKGDVTLLHKK